MFVGKLGRQAGEFFQGVINGRERQFFGFNFAAVGVAAYLETGLLNQLAQFDNAVELRLVFTLQLSFLDTGNFFDSGIGRGAKPQDVRLSASALAEHIGKRARKGKALATRIKPSGLTPIG